MMFNKQRSSKTGFKTYLTKYDEQMETKTKMLVGLNLACHPDTRRREERCLVHIVYI